MQTLTILRGLPGSGKTTLASKMLAGATTPTIRINRDDLRAMIVGKDNDLYGGTKSGVNAREKLVRNMRDALIKCALESGTDVIVDDTNLINYTMNHKADEAYMAQMLKKRLFLSLIWVVGAALVAGLVVLIF